MSDTVLLSFEASETAEADETAERIEHNTQLKEEVADLREQVSTLEELLQLYEASAIEQEQQLQGAMVELKEHAQQLEHAQEALQTLQTTLDSMGDAVIVAGRDGQALFVNPAAQRLLKGEAVSRSFRDWLQTAQLFESDGVTPYSMESLPLTRAIGGESVDAAEMRWVTSTDPAGRWLSVTARPILAAESVTGAVAVFRDVTQRKQFEQDLQRSHHAAKEQAQLLEKTLSQLKQTQAQLVHGEKMSSLGQTVAGIAHEVNNPVNFIHGNLTHTKNAFHDLLDLVQLFRSTYQTLPIEIEHAIEEIDLDFLAADIPPMLASMTQGTQRIREIVKSLRVFSRLDEAELKSVDIHEGIDSAVMLVRSRFAATDTRHDITLRRDYSTCEHIKCYARELNQVFVHLLSNAIDALAMNAGNPEIIIRTYSNGETLTVEIEDNGEGIPADIRAKVFDPFFTTKPVGTGTGIGLSICHQIVVEMHSGNIACLSEVGQGSRFVVTLPYVQ
ncbi:MAG: ATP-binding protein [Cyanobacteria bacterium P01_F01_bin.53]